MERPERLHQACPFQRRQVLYLVFHRFKLRRLAHVAHHLNQEIAATSNVDHRCARNVLPGRRDRCLGNKGHLTQRVQVDVIALRILLLDVNSVQPTRNHLRERDPFPLVRVPLLKVARERSPEDPVPIGFAVSPNAEVQDDLPAEYFDWTTHNHDVISKGNTTLMVSGDYHEGTVVYDVSDPRDPTPTDQYRTDDDAENTSDLLFPALTAPMAWGADYSAERDLVFTSDMVTGAYVFKVTPAAARDSAGRGRGRNEGRGRGNGQ